jgi:hypothetical protein
VLRPFTQHTRTSVTLSLLQEFPRALCLSLPPPSLSPPLSPLLSLSLSSTRAHAPTSRRRGRCDAPFTEHTHTRGTLCLCLSVSLSLSLPLPLSLFPSPSHTHTHTHLPTGRRRRRRDAPVQEVNDRALRHLISMRLVALTSIRLPLELRRRQQKKRF